MTRPSPDGVPGISVVVCCHNGAKRLPETFAHLMRQVSDVDWELLLVDNASTDGTAEVARGLWPDHPSAPLRIVHEPRPGLSHARRRAFDEARFGLVGFVDDDNWPDPDWVQRAAKVMAEHPEAGACGGTTEAVFEAPPPPWFAEFAEQFVVGPQSEAAGDVTDTRGVLWGAGLTVRKEAWLDLSERGFRSTLSGRTGRILTSGEDYELCYALRLAGWRLRYDPSLRLRHFMPAGRVTWDYLRRLNRGHGVTSLGFDPYEVALAGSDRHLVRIFGRLWLGEASKAAGKFLFRHGWDWIRTRWSPQEGSAGILRAEYQIGRLGELLRRRLEYDRTIRELSDAQWIAQPRPRVSPLR